MKAKSTYRQQVHCLAETIKSLPTMPSEYRVGPAYGHMGALLADGVLQAGLNYRTVVRPRVDRILNLWSDAVCTSDLIRLIHECGAAYLLQWRHEEKVNRFVGLVHFVHQHSVDTVTDFAAWLKNDENLFELRALRGVGPKTVDYLKNLAGVPTIAVDRHIRAFVESSGISCESYAQVRLLVEDAAAVLRLPPSIVDHAIWLHRSLRS